MQKDYYLVRSELTAADELARIDAFWTSVWADRDMQAQPAAREAIEASDEYRVIAPYLRQLPKGARILDGGCGMGQWCLYLDGRGFQPRGVDISAATINRLCEEFPDGDWAVEDINNLECADATYDAYLSWGTFEHFEAGLRPPIVEAFRVLKPGGYLFISVPQDSLRMMPGRYFTKWPAVLPADEGEQVFYQWRLTKAELAFELGCGGFEVADIQAISKQEGVGRLFRMLTGRAPDGPLSARAVKALAMALPGGLVGHMVLAIARKPL